MFEKKENKKRDSNHEQEIRSKAAYPPEPAANELGIDEKLLSIPSSTAQDF